MEKLVSAADANRKFSELLRGVRQGHSYVVTSHGRPIARILPAGENEDSTFHARSSLLKRLRSQRAVSIGRWKREELYEADDARRPRH